MKKKTKISINDLLAKDPKLSFMLSWGEVATVVKELERDEAFDCATYEIKTTKGKSLRVPGSLVVEVQDESIN